MVRPAVRGSASAALENSRRVATPFVLRAMPTPFPPDRGGDQRGCSLGLRGRGERSGAGVGLGVLEGGDQRRRAQGGRRSAWAWVACQRASSSAFSSWISRWRAWSSWARWPGSASKRRSSLPDLRLEAVGQAAGPGDQAVGGVPLGDGGPDLGDGPLLGRLERHQRPAVLGLALNHQRLAVVQDRQGRDVDEADVLDADLVALVERADDRGRDPVPLGQADGGRGAVACRAGGVDVGPVLQAPSGSGPGPRSRGMFRGRMNSPSGSAVPADSGTPIWLRRSVRALA